MVLHHNIRFVVLVLGWLSFSGAVGAQSSKPVQQRAKVPARQAGKGKVAAKKAVKPKARKPSVPMPNFPKSVALHLKTLGHPYKGKKAARALQKLGPIAVPALVWALENGKKRLSETALYSLCTWPTKQRLSSLKPTLHKLLKVALTTSNKARIRAALQTASRHHVCDVTTQRLAVKHLNLKKHGRDINRQILRYLGHCGAKAKASLPAVLKVVAKKSSLLRWVAMDAVSHIGVRSSSDVKAILSLAGTMRFSRKYVFAALWRLGPQAKSAIPFLLNRLKNESQWKMRSHVIDTLGQIHSNPKRVVPVLVERLHDLGGPKPKTGLGGIGTFGLGGGGVLMGGRGRGRGGFGVYRRPAFKPIRTCLYTTRSLPRHWFGTKRVQVAASEALAEYGVQAKSAAPYLMRLLESHLSSVRAAARNALIAIGSVALPHVKKGLRSDNTRVRAECERILLKMKLPPEVAFKMALEVAKDCRRVNNNWSILLKQLGRKILPALLKCLSPGKSSQKYSVVQALRKIGAPGVLILAKRLRASRKDNVQSMYLDILSQLHEKGYPAASTVTLLLYHNEPDIRKKAAKTLLRFGSKVAPLIRKAYPLLLIDVRKEMLDAIGSNLKDYASLLPLFLFDESKRFRSQATKVLAESGYISVSAKHLMPILQQMLQHKALDIQKNALLLTKKLGSDAAPLVRDVIRLAKHSDKKVSILALQVLKNMGKKATPALPLVLSILKQGLKKPAKKKTKKLLTSKIHVKVIKAKKGKSKKAKKAKNKGTTKPVKAKAPTSKRARFKLPPKDTSNDIVRKRMALRRKRRKKLIQLILRKKGLLGTLSRSNNIYNSIGYHSNSLPERMDLAIQILRNLGAKAAPAVPLLVRVLVEKAHTHSKVLSILKSLGAKSAPAVPHLIKVVQGKYKRRKGLVGLFGSASDYYVGGGVRKKAALVLGAIGPAAKAAVPALRSIANAKKAAVRLAAIQALAAMGLAAKEAVPTFVKAVKTKTGKRYTRRLLRGILGGVSSSRIGSILSAKGSGTAFGVGGLGYAGSGLSRRKPRRKYRKYRKPPRRYRKPRRKYRKYRKPRSYGLFGRYRGRARRYRRRYRRRRARLNRLGRYRRRKRYGRRKVKKARVSIKDQNWKIQHAAADALGKLGRHAKAALPDLTTMLKDNDLKLVQKVKKAIAAIQKDSRPGSPKAKIPKKVRAKAPTPKK